jgi:WD40 repeat protein
LPDGQHFIYAAITPPSLVTIRVASIGSAGTDSQIIPEVNELPVYSNGYLLFLNNSTLMARPFDLKRLSLFGEAVPVAEEVAPGFSVSENGLLVYQRVTSNDRQLAWFDRSGKQITTVGEPGALRSFGLSPDLKSVALTIDDNASRNSDIWILEIVRGLRNRFTFDPATDNHPVWSPDGRSIVFTSSRKGHSDLYRKTIDSPPGSEGLVYADNFQKTPTSWSRDGKYLLYYADDPKTKNNLWILPMTGERKPFSFAQTEFTEMQGVFSPDGRWIAYVSDESGSAEVYAAPFPGPGGKRQISIKQREPGNGGVPSWRSDGKEIFYIAPDRSLMSVQVSANGTTLDVGKPQKLFGPILAAGGHNYEVSPDGQHFLAQLQPGLIANEPLTLVQNWLATLKK